MRIIKDKNERTQNQSQSQLLDFSNIALQNFVNSLKSKNTRTMYLVNLKKYLSHYNMTVETLLNVPLKEAEQLLINYIEKLKTENKSHSYLNSVFCSVKHLYVMNDIRINKEKIAKFLGESGRKNTDRGYTHEEIKKLLDVSDLRMKTIILLMASTGIRIGAVTEIKLKHLEEVKDKGLYKITVYEKSKEQYYAFCSFECYSAINAYLDFRKKSGEILDKETYLIREQFDIDDFEQIRKKSRSISLYTLKTNMQILLRKAGIRQINPNYEYGDRTQIPMSHGFRKFWMTQAVKSKMPAEQREMLLGHKIGLASAYYRPTENDMLEAYMVGVDLLTINEENRLKKKVDELQSKYDEIGKLVQRIDLLEKKNGMKLQ